MRFANRRDAGRQLAQRLLALADEDPVVLALPRGGVPVGAEVARALGAPLDVLVAKKIGAPFQRELAIGAVAESGAIFVDRRLCQAVGVDARQLEPLAEETRIAVAEAVQRLRGSRPLPSLTNRAVIIVDDGLATGATARAAIEAVAGHRPRRIVLAVPVAAAQTAARLRRQVDELVAVEEPTDLESVGQWYADFRPVDDEEVAALLHDRAPAGSRATRTTTLPVEDAALLADVTVPEVAHGVVVFAHGSGSGRASPRNRAVARQLERAGFATVLVDLLTEREQEADAETGQHRFDIELLAKRLIGVIDELATDARLAHLPIGCFGSSTGAAAAIIAAAARPTRVTAVVSRGGRVDLAGGGLGFLRAPTLLLVGSDDETVLELNQRALDELRCEKQLSIIEGAGHLFEEPGALETVATLAARWFGDHVALAAAATTRAGERS